MLCGGLVFPVEPRDSPPTPPTTSRCRRPLSLRPLTPSLCVSVPQVAGRFSIAASLLKAAAGGDPAALSTDPICVCVPQVAGRFSIAASLLKAAAGGDPAALSTDPICVCVPQVAGRFSIAASLLKAAAGGDPAALSTDPICVSVYLRWPAGSV